jgi:hypothetical protein
MRIVDSEYRLCGRQLGVFDDRRHGLNPQSPAFKSAQQACGSVIKTLSRRSGAGG